MDEAAHTALRQYPVAIPPEELPYPSTIRNANAITATYAKLAENPHAKRSRTHSAAQRAGKRYEKRVIAATIRELSDKNITVMPSPWIEYRLAEEHKRHFCQPDMLLFHRNVLYICEIKYTHTADAYWQMQQLYAPVCRLVFKKYIVRFLEITRSFDPAIRFPVEAKLFFDLADVLLIEPSVGILQWKL